MYNNTPELFFDSSLLADSETTIEYKITHRIITYEMDNPTPRLEVCPHCGHIGLHIHRKKQISLSHASTGIDLIKLLVHYNTYRCPECKKIITESIPFRCGDAYYTSYYKAQALFMIAEYGYTLKNAARIMHATPKQMKDFKKEYLENISGDLKPKHYSRYIAIDEFLLEHPHRYCTIIIDAETGELLYLEKGKSKAQVEGFIKFVGDDFMSHVQAVAMDMNNTYYTAIHERFPHIGICYDAFHLIKWYQDKVLGPLRKTEYKRLKKVAEALQKEGKNEEATAILAEASKLFESRFLLMSSRKTLEAKDKANKELNKEVKERYEALGEKIPNGYRFRREDNLNTLNCILEANENIAIAYDLGGELQDIIHCRSVADIEEKLNAWLKTAENAKVAQITWFTKTIKNRWDGIVGMAKYGINSAILEGVNGYIKNMRRSSFGFSDFDFFGLLIWEHTHMKAKRKTEEASHVKKRYKPRSKPNSKKASKQTIYIKERDSNGKIISA